MDKKQFFSLFNNIDEFDISKLYEKFQLARRAGIAIFTNEFYTPDVWSTLENLNLNDLLIESYGIFPDSDRRVIGFNRSYYEEFPVKLIKIKCNTKFTKLAHKDYLGSIMALGIKREKLGEIILGDECAYVAIQEDMVDFLISSLNKIRNLTCKCTIVGDDKPLPEAKYEESVVISTSTRLDCIVAAIGNVSRSKATELVSQGKVLVNYICTTDKSHEVKENIKITIKGLGKFKICEISGITKSGRLKMTVYKYS